MTGVLASPCVTSADCQSVITNSQCKGGTCQCLTGYTQDGGSLTSCRLMTITDTCQSTSQCLAAVPNSTCSGGRCQCDAGYLATGANTVCRPRILGDSCSSTIDCSIFISSASCSSTGTCQCLPGYQQNVINPQMCDR